ncbi:class I SAM-dependent methyltransferase [Halomarina litorea]|uniref:class I SAM-dependent methyltransferase n=1 Tax=Halomarina litorea TaxID=2961595 RepID=UPI0020C45EC7|nr:class I SAM-dependent methyltransferase [Halomarina sp. BCD28]
MTEDPRFEWWNDRYAADDTPWSVGRPQPAVVRLVETGAVEGRVLDVGCGRGEHARYLGERGHPVVGIDGSERAIEQARAATDAADVTFRVADVLALPADLGRFDTVLDCGLFHVFADTDTRRRYADSLAGVVDAGGRVHVLAFAEGAPEDWGPTPVPRGGFAAAFEDGWAVRGVSETVYESAGGEVPAFVARVERV